MSCGFVDDLGTGAGKDDQLEGVSGVVGVEAGGMRMLSCGRICYVGDGDWSWRRTCSDAIYIETASINRNGS